MSTPASKSCFCCPSQKKLPTQQFSLIGSTEIKEIECQRIEGQYVVLWRDIQQTFPRVHYVSDDEKYIEQKKDKDRKQRCVMTLESERISEGHSEEQLRTEQPTPSIFRPPLESNPVASSTIRARS